MAKAYESPEEDDSSVAPTDVLDGSSVSETGHKGGATAAAHPGDEPPAQFKDYTGTTSEKSRARYVVPFIIAFIVIASFFALRTRFTPGSVGGHDPAINATGGTTAGTTDASQNGAAIR